MNRFIITTAIFLIIVVFGIGLWYPKYQKTRLVWQETAVKKRMLEYQREHFLNVRTQSEKLKDHQESLSKINSALPDFADYPSLFRFLENLCSESGLVLKEINPSLVETKEPESLVKQSRVSVAVSGSYLAFKNFLFGLEKSSRLIEVQSIDFFTPKEEQVFTFNLDIKVYSY